MHPELTKFIQSWLKYHDRPMRYLAKNMSYSEGHVGDVIKGKKGFSYKFLRELSEAMSVNIIELYLISGVLTEEELREYAVIQLARRNS